MSDEKPKPLAEVVLRNDAPYDHRAVVLCGGKVVFWSEFASMCDEVATAINAAVEAREARLRGALVKAAKQLAWHDEFRTRYVDHACAECVPGADHIIAGFQCGRHATVAALGPNPPAYVPKSQLDEANATVAKMRAAFDALDVAQYGAHGPTVAEFLVEAGFKRLNGLGDQQLLDMKRKLEGEVSLRTARGFHPQAIRDAVCPHCNNFPYDGPTRRCPECGIDRHGVGHGAG